MADNTGARERNVELSLERAQSVRDYLSSHGVAADRIVARGAGPDEPLVPGKTKQARQKNRRIDFHLITTGQ